MKLSDRLLTVWTYTVGLGLSLLGMAAYLLDWPLAVQFALPLLMIFLLGATEPVVRRARRRRR